MTDRRYIRSSRPYFPREDIEPMTRDIAESLETGRLRNGENLKKFESMFAEYVGAKHAVAFDSDGNALETVLQHFNVKNHEVVVCTNSFISIPNSVAYAGGKVVFADIGEETLSMCHESLLENISKDTCGVVVTHIAGFPNSDLREIGKICEEYELFLVEDATHAVGASINGQKAGTFGDAAVFAFTPTKVLTTGEGGMLVTNDTELGEGAKRMRYYGSGQGKTEFVSLGRHMMLPEISAVLGIYQLRRIEEFIAKRNHIAEIYDTHFRGTEAFDIVTVPASFRCSYYKYPLKLNPRIDKAKFVEVLDREYGVETGTVFYPPCHLQSLYRKHGVAVYRGGLSVSERVLSRTITLPMHAALTDEDAEYVVESLNKALRGSHQQ